MNFKFLLSTFCFLLCVTGCVTRSPESRIPSPESRMVSVIVPHPVQPYTVFVPVFEAPEAPLAVQPITFGVAWDASPAVVPDGSLAYEVQVTTNLSTWVSYQTTELRFVLPKDTPQKFFRVRSVNSAGCTSEWATTR